MSRAALIVGVDTYDHNDHLKYCCKDARRVEESLQAHHDGRPNFECEMLSGNSGEKFSEADLMDRLQFFFSREAEIVLFYFAGHGWPGHTGETMLGCAASRYGHGVLLRNVVVLANHSPAKQRIIILDCCCAGGYHIKEQASEIAMGTTLIAACRRDEPALEDPDCGGGVLTNLICDGLSGSAADVLGRVTCASIYDYVETSLGVLEQRPTFVTHVDKYITLRQARPSIDIDVIRELPKLFPEINHKYPLDPSFEPKDDGRPTNAPPPHPVNTSTFAKLQALCRSRLVLPSHTHMWDSAMHTPDGGQTWDGYCTLTPLGQGYWRQAKGGRI